MGRLRQRLAGYDLEELGRSLRGFRRVLVTAGLVGLGLAGLLTVRLRSLASPEYLLLVVSVVLTFVAAARLLREPVLWTRVIAAVQAAGFLFADRGGEWFWPFLAYRLGVLGFVAIAAEAQQLMVRHPELTRSRRWRGDTPRAPDQPIESRYLDRVREDLRAFGTLATGAAVILAAGCGWWLWTLRRAYQPPDIEPYAREVQRLWDAGDRGALERMLRAGGGERAGREFRAGLADRGWTARLPRLAAAWKERVSRDAATVSFALAGDPDAAGVDAHFTRRDRTWRLASISTIDVADLVRALRDMR